MVDLIQRIVDRLTGEADLNCIILITGEVGSGKSSSALRIAEEVTKRTGADFGVDNIVFTSSEFLTQIQKGSEHGGAVVMDDAGIGYSNRSWYKYSNKVLGQVLQSFRFKRMLTIFTTPSMDYIDKQSRKLFHYMIRTHKIDYANEEVCGWLTKPMENIYNNSSYHQYLRDERGNRIRHVRIGKPSDELFKGYQDKKQGFMDEEYNKMLKNLVGRGQHQGVKFDKVKKEVLDNMDKYSSELKTKDYDRLDKGLMKDGFPELSQRGLNSMYQKLKKDEDIKKALGQD